MFKKLLLSMVAMLAISSMAFGQYPDPRNGNFECNKVAELSSNSDVDLLFCNVGRNLNCFATSEGQLDCGFSSNFSYRASDYGRSWDTCRQVTTLQRRGGGYPLRREGIELCRIGQGRRAINCFVSSLGGIDCR